MRKRILYIYILFASLLCMVCASSAIAQNADTMLEGVIDKELLPSDADQELQDEDEQYQDELPQEISRIEGGAAGEGDDRRKVSISGMVVMNYVFDNSPDSFTVRYRWELSGNANASTSVIKGDLDIDAEVDGYLAKWPTGECALNITIPKVPFELTFRKDSEEKGDIRIQFKQGISENWQSNCTFHDAPGARFETSGPPERWFEKALSKARPPIRSIVVNLSDDETTTPLVIPKETIGDPPVGSMEVEGTASITVTPAEG
ncbi:MAG: hypothetical protein BWY40_00442 [bacterium ADurb.Bin270]|jgi:hypothetical protein|nr:MAG: hypothetical protein BWY40_00442 [bacterium ADurb.Bin270]HQG13584.1 hypothetical protein [bacterium]